MWSLTSALMSSWRGASLSTKAFPSTFTSRAILLGTVLIHVDAAGGHWLLHAELFSDVSLLYWETAVKRREAINPSTVPVPRTNRFHTNSQSCLQGLCQFSMRERIYRIPQSVNLVPAWLLCSGMRYRDYEWIQNVLVSQVDIFIQSKSTGSSLADVKPATQFCVIRGLTGIETTSLTLSLAKPK
jgi:hypothetical protein